MKDIQVPKLSNPPRLEQFLNGASRGDMKRIDDFRQRQPGDGVPVSRKTSAWIGYDNQNFYVVFVCESPAGQTRARLAKREEPDSSGDGALCGVHGPAGESRALQRRGPADRFSIRHDGAAVLCEGKLFI